MESLYSFFQYTLVLSVILTTIYTAFFYREVYAAGAVIPRFVRTFFFSSILFLFLNKALEWSPEKIFSLTVKFFLVLSFVGTVAHIIKVLMSKNYSGMNLISFIILLTIFIICLSVVVKGFI